MLNQSLINVPTQAALGAVAIGGTGLITGSQFVVNGVDLAGTYATPTVLLNYINTGVIPNVTASLVAGNMTLTNSAAGNIIITTAGSETAPNFVTFVNFSLMNGQLSINYATTGLDGFYTSYLKFALADRHCTEYNFIVPPGVTKQLVQYERWILNVPVLWI